MFAKNNSFLHLLIFLCIGALTLAVSPSAIANTNKRQVSTQLSVVEPTGLVPVVYLPFVTAIDTASSATTAAAYAHLHTMINLHYSDDTLRLADSYLDNENDQEDTAWVYDNSLVILALLARGDTVDREQARLLANSLLYAQAHDPVYVDGRLRDAYHAEQLILANGQTNIASYGSSTGNMAWAMLALLAVWQESGEAAYLTSAENLANWVVTNTYDTRGGGGFTGGVDGNNTARQWKSTEHNTDLVAAFRQLYEATQDPQWLTYSNHADTLVRAMWHTSAGHFWTGTTTNGTTINYYPIPEDTQSWPVLALNNTASYQAGLDWAVANLMVTACADKYTDVSGIRFSSGGQGCSFEATAHLALALSWAGKTEDAIPLLHSLRTVLLTETEMNGGLVAAPPGGAPSGFGFSYPYSAHIGATAWYLFAEHGFNPFTSP